jgi:predicted AlkP superfamily phosphohydrolase/phosphomutase
VSRRALVIGLDGMPRALLFELAALGHFRRIGELMDVGYCAPLRAPVPEISSTSWATFLTGTNPARHGIFGFVDLVPGPEPATYFPTAATIAEPTLWEHVERSGGRTVCLNVPGTYPATGFDGVLVSGFVSPNFERATMPPRIRAALRALEYELDVEVGDVGGDPIGFIGRASRALLARTAAFEHLLTTEQWQLGVAVFTETDRVQHFLWRGVTDDSHPRHAALMSFYDLVDECVGRLLDLVGDDDELFLVSDHGFGPADRQLYVNAWLRAAGYLAGPAECPVPAALDGRSVAFALDPARIYLNRSARFSNGRVGEAAAGDLAEELAARLVALRADGPVVRPDADGPLLVRAVHRAPDVYSGPLLGHAPDLVAEGAWGTQLRGGWDGTDLLRPDVLTGTHTRDNAIFYRRGAAPSESVEMADVAPTVLAALGIPVDGLDGQPRLTEPRRTGVPAPLAAADRRVGIGAHAESLSEES